MIHRTIILTCALAVGIIAQAANRIFSVKAGDAESLLAAIQQANESNKTADAERSIILIPNGTYDLGKRVLTTISGNHISLIGQSMDGTIIVNAPDKANEGISKTATILNKSDGLYMQDLTLKNALDYYGTTFAGRAVCLQDKGTHTICKNVRLLSYQDTYFSDNNDTQFYFEDCEIHGTVDFICGGSDVYFYRCTLVTEPRDKTGEGQCTITAPRTKAGQTGYVFMNCTIRNNQSMFNLGRGWNDSPKCAFIHTRMLSPEKLIQTRYCAKGMNTVNVEFYEYHSTDANGQLITPKSNIVTFTMRKAGQQTAETVIGKQDARRFALKKVFPTWRPDRLVKKLHHTWKD
ncbi:MAG: pectinesterase family protein [Prevotella sp.]|nr:pectinesterase family protein [Prevotella sp.]